MPDIYLTGGPVFHVTVEKRNALATKPAAPAPAPQTQIAKRSDAPMADYNVSGKEKAWNRILGEVDKILQANPQDPRSREQVVAAYLMTPAGKRLYSAYANNQDPDELEKAANTSLRDWAWSVMEKMESDEQARNPATKAMDVLKKLSRNKTYQNLYHIYNDPDSGLPAAQALERISKRNATLASAYPFNFGD